MQLACFAAAPKKGIEGNSVASLLWTGREQTTKHVFRQTLPLEAVGMRAARRSDCGERRRSSCGPLCQTLGAWGRLQARILLGGAYHIRGKSNSASDGQLHAAETLERVRKMRRATAGEETGH